MIHSKAFVLCFHTLLTINCGGWCLRDFSVRESTFGEINTCKHTAVSQAVSSPLMKCSGFSRAAHHMMLAYHFDNGWKIPLPSLGSPHHPSAFGVYFSGFFFSTWRTIMREFSMVSRCRLAVAGPSTGSAVDFFFFFPRMYIKASYASGGISAGDCRDSPHEQDDDIVFIVFLFFFFPTSPPSPPSCLNPHIKLPAKYCWLNKI